MKELPFKQAAFIINYISMLISWTKWQSFIFIYLLFNIEPYMFHYTLSRQNEPSGTEVAKLFMVVTIYFWVWFWGLLYRRDFMSDNENIIKICSLGRYKHALGENWLTFFVFLLKVQVFQLSLKQIWCCFQY